jgi:hypothetical protein
VRLGQILNGVQPKKELGAAECLGKEIMSTYGKLHFLFSRSKSQELSSPPIQKQSLLLSENGEKAFLREIEVAEAWASKL